MEQEKLIIDYIIEQAERFDIKNLQFEEDIKFKETDRCSYRTSIKLR